MKKILSLAICLLIIISCGTTAFAVETNQNYNTASPDQPSIYEYVSNTLPNKTTYIFEDCAYPCSLIVPNLLGYFIDPDLTGMTVTLKNKQTGELETYGPESIVRARIDVDHVRAEIMKETRYPLFAYVVAKNGEEVFFYDVCAYVTFRNKPKNDTEETTTPNENPTESTIPAPQISTADSATSDEVIVAPTTVGNKPVGTGDFFPACIVFVAMSALTIGAILAYRKKKQQ